MITWGWTGMSHDASLAVFSDDGLEFAAHSERYSRIKNDPNLHDDLITEALEYGHPDRIYFYERSWLKKLRQLSAGQYQLLKKPSPTQYMRQYLPTAPRSRGVSHHLSHAAGGYFTGPYTDATVVCIDSIGEFETLTVWTAKDNSLTKVYSQNYPHSIGLWYSSMTQRIGLKPQEHEYILMGMAALGDPHRFFKEILEEFVDVTGIGYSPRTRFKHNLHRGCKWWRPDLTTEQDYYDIAAAVQKVYEYILQNILCWAGKNTPSKNLILMGGCALNCAANSLAYRFFDNVWIMPNPGDAGSAIGCVLAKRREFMFMEHTYTGHNITGKYPVEEIIHELTTNRITAVAAGRAEFGPRALGNRSILADPRGHDVKDRVNSIKQREPFRPFAPAILAEHATDYFDGVTGPYMQFTSKCRRPDEFPAIIHYDGTSRVQAVPAGDTSGFRALLERWYAETGCPMLLNTSLNIKGDPLVNTREDALHWTQQYGVKVCLPKSGDG